MTIIILLHCESISQKVYNDKTRWPHLYDLNKETIGPNPDRIYIGQVLITAEL